MTGRLRGNLRQDEDTIVLSQGASDQLTITHPASNTAARVLTLPANDADYNLPAVIHGGDTTKAVQFTSSGATTAKTLNFATSHTDNRTLTLPDATDTLVGRATSDTLTNKIITALQITAGSTIDTNSSGTLGIGQINATTVTIGRTGQSLVLAGDVTISGNLDIDEVQDDTFNIVDEGDETKRLNFSLGGATTSTRTTIAASQGADRTITLPDATDTLVGRATTDTLTNKTLTSPTINGGSLVGASTLSINDNASNDLILASANGALTADRTLNITMPDSNVALTLTGDFIRSGAHSLTLTTTGVTNVTLPTSGTLATGSGSSTDHAIARYDGTGGTIQDSGVIIDDSDNVSGLANLTLSGDIDAASAAALDIGTTTATAVNIGRSGQTTVIKGNLQVDGTTTTVNSTTLDVTDANITVNNGGNQAAAEDTAGLTVEMSDATDAVILYNSDSATFFSLGESGSVDDVVGRTATQTLTNKTLTSPTINGGTVNDPTTMTVDDENFTIGDATGSSSTLAFRVDSVGSAAVTIVSNPASASTLTLPNATSTIATTGLTETLSNKTLAAATATTSLQLDNAAELRFEDDAEANYMGFKAPATLTTTTNFTLPDGDGSNGQVLGTNGSATLSWIDPSGVETDTHAVSGADYTVLDADGYRTILMSPNSALDRTVTLPTAADNTDRIITIKKVSSSSGFVIVDGEGAETIDGATTIDLEEQYDSITLVCDGTEWHSIDYRLATADQPGAVQSLNKWQIIELAADATATGNQTLITFNNLVVGKHYRIYAQALLSASATGQDFVTIEHNSAIIASDKTSMVATNLITLTPEVVFTATTTTATVEATLQAAATVFGNSTRSETWAMIEELNNYDDETTDFT